MLALCVATWAVVPPSEGPDVQLAAAEAIARYELAWWKRNHPKADLSITFSDPTVTPTQTELVRSRLGLKPGPAVLDADVLTVVFDHAQKLGSGRLGAEAFVFLGSFPKGFHARYQLVAKGKKDPVVLTRTVLEKYDMDSPAKPKTNT